jgi:hypothetical protein
MLEPVGLRVAVLALGRRRHRRLDPALAATDRELTSGQRLAVNVLKEKAGVTLPGQAAGFAAAARRVAASTPGRG